MRKQLFLAAASVALLAVPTLASAGDTGWYVRGNVGYGVISDVDFTGDLVGDVEGEGNVAASLGLGYEFGNNWRLELDATQLWNDMGAIDQAGNTSSDMRITSGMLNAIYDFSDFGSWQPYVGAGIGIARASLSAQAHSLPNGGVPLNSPTCSSANACAFHDADTGVAWQLLAGLGYKITDNLTWDTQYRYMNVGDLDYTGRGQNLIAPIGAGVLGGGSSLTTSASVAGSHSVMTGLRYRFGAKPAPVMYSCWDGSSVLDTATCPAVPIVYTTCWDGTQVESGTSCPVKPVVQCWDGSTVTDAASCPTRPTVTCWDGTIAYEQTSCPVKTVCDEGFTDFKIYFPWDKSGLTDQAKAVVANAAGIANQCSITDIVIEGHTDSSGAQSYNVGLSNRRADSVEAELRNSGITTTNIVKTANGETALAVSTPDGVREPLNRRTEVVIRLIPANN
ncbi:OmpA family protein [bacterium AH-315-J23]|nr:OmpA family protein [bacterium AH-315-J23]